MKSVRKYPTSCFSALIAYKQCKSVLLLLLLSFFATATLQAQAWYNQAWSYRKAITIDAAKVGAGPHINFPILINRADADLQAWAQTDADDILFTSADGTTKLAHEIESYTPTSGTLVAWVKIPSLSSAANTTIYMYYGNSGAASQQSVAATWDASFRGVYHLNNVFTDATSNAFNGTNTGTTSVGGKISNGRGFVPSNGADFITINGLMGSPANLTLSSWALLTARDVSGAQVITIGNYALIDGGDVNGGALGVAYFNATWNATGSGTNYAGTGWHYLTYTFDDAGNVQRFYVDGIQVGATNFTPSISYTGQGANTRIGSHGNGSTAYDFDGSIDEVRVANSVRSAGWILTEYNNQNSPATFYSVGVASCNTPPPTVVSPVNYCQNAPASQLTASGSNLLWGGTGTTSGSVGGTADLSTKTYIDNLSDKNHRKTIFRTQKNNVTITTVDYTIPAYQETIGLTLGIFDAAGNKIATSSTTTSIKAGATSSKISCNFNFTIAAAGEYSIGVSSGSGNIGSDNPAFPITEPTGTINITGVSVAGIRCFNNIQFTTSSATTVAPTPSTAVVGTTNYTVTQTASGCANPSGPATITVNVNPVPAFPALPTSGLIARYNFSGNATDASGTGNHGTLQGAPSLVADRNATAGAAYSFNGSSQYVSTTTSISNPNNFTYVVWFRTTTTTGGKLIGFGNAQTGSSTSYDRHIYMSNSGQLYFGLYPTAVRTINTAPTFNDGQWHQVVASLSSTNGMKLYVDGNLLASDATTVSGENATGWFKIGYDNNNGWTNQPTSYYFNGTLDDISIYNRELTSSEVTAMYSGASTPSSNAPICPGQTLNLTAPTLSGATYSWTGPNGFTSNLQNPSIANVTSAHAGTYTVTATVNGCNTAPTNVVVSLKPAPSATISYNAPLCRSATSEPVTLTGTAGGVFSSTAGLSINASTGAINPSASTAGTYTVTYTITGAECTATATTSVTIFNAPTVSGVVTETCVGGSTGTITASASGGTAPYTFSLNGGAYQSATQFTGLAAGNYTLGVRSNTGCVASTTVTVAPFATSADNQNATATNTWVGHMYDGTAFNNYLGQFAEAETFNETFGGATTCFNVVSNSLSRSIYTETFSVRFRMQSTKRGLYVVDLGSDDGSRLTVNETMVYNNWSDQAFTTKTGVLMNLNGNSSLLYEYYENGGGNQVIFQNLTLVFSNTLSANTTQSICLGNGGAAIGGDTYGALPAGISLAGTGYQWSYSTTPGGARTNIAGATGANFTPATNTAPFNAIGTYYLYRNAVLSSTNNIAPNPYVATNESNAATITVTAAPAATISYAGSPYCSDGGTATVTRSGTSGGTYASTAGLSINASTGEITLASSTPGTYTVTYTMAATGGCTVQTATTSVAISASPAATIAYTGGPYSTTGGTATVSFSGTPGGTYSSTAGLSINAATGSVTLGSSAIGSYVVTYTVAAAGGCAVFTTTTNITVLNGSKTFTGVGVFSDPARWTGGTVPVAGEDLIIDGTCTVDNNAGTDNIAYGTLRVGTATGRTLNWAANGTNRLNVAQLSHGTAISTLDMTNGGTLVIRESTAITNMNYLPGAGTIEVQATMTLLPAPVFNNLTINGAGIIVRLSAATTLNGSLTISAGAFNAANFNLTVKKNWTNNAAATAFTAGTGTVTFNGTTAQTIGGSFPTAFNNITISNPGGSVVLATNAQIAGNLSVTAGTFDLGNFTADRTTAGGTLLLSNNTLLKIGGTGTFPSNFTTNNLVVASTVEYAGGNQTISNQTYGNLTLSSASEAAVKTFPATPLTIVGNLTSAVGAGTSVAYTAAANISVAGNITIGASTTFNGGSYTHTVGGNWVNSGTFTGNTSTLVLNGAGTTVSGSGAQNFNNLTIAASSVAFSANTITVSGNLATTGAGTFSQTSGGTLLMTGTGKTISGDNIALDNLTVSGSVSTTAAMNLAGNLSVGGSFTGNAGAVTMNGTAKAISGSGTINFGTLSITGSVTTTINLTISSGLLVSNSFTATAGTVTFTNTSTLSGPANLFNAVINGTSLQLSSNSILGIGGQLTMTAGVLDVTSFVPNTVTFNGAGAQNVNAIAYCNLVMSGGNTKTAAGNITTARDVTIGANTTFNAAAHTLSIYGNWINNGTLNAGTSTVQFLGASPGFLKGATTFNILTSNTSATTTLVLQNDVSTSILNMTAGIIRTGVNTLTITNTRTGNGTIWGNIRRTHAFTTGINYAFEGPENTINFSAVSGVNSITVSVTDGSIADFPFGGSIARMYNIVIPSGTYNATLRLHYEDNELNGNTESSMALWRFSGTAWGSVGKTGFNTTANYVEISGLTDITNRWTCSDNSNVVQWNGSISTDWNTPGNWTVLAGAGSRPPSATDIVNLGTADFNHHPTISNTVTVKNIIFGSTKATTLTLTSGGGLTSGDINGAWSANATHSIQVNNQAVTVNGDLSLSDGIAGHAIDLNVGSGTVHVNGSLFQSGSAGISFSTGSLNVFHDFVYAGGTFNAGNGTVVYDGTDHQNIASVGYNHLTINKAAGTAVVDNNTHVEGNLTVLSGGLENRSFLDIIGNVVIQPGAEIQDHDMMHVGGNWTNSGTYIGTGAQIKFKGTGTQYISGSTFNNLEINKPVGSSAILTGNLVILGNVTVTSGTLNLKAFSCNRAVSGGTVVLSDLATVIFEANNMPTNFTSRLRANSSTVIADGTVAQQIIGGTYGNLILRNTGVKTISAPITVNGNLTIDNGANFNGGNQAITIMGNWVNNGTFTPATSTVILGGMGKTVSGENIFNAVTVTGSYTVFNNQVYNGLLNITSTGALSAGPNVHSILHGDLINSGVVYILGTTTYSGNVLQTLNLINAVQTVALTVTFNGSVSPQLNSTSAPQFGYLNINNTGGINPSVDWTILYALNIGNGASFNGGSSTHNILGSLTNAGTITSNGVLNFAPSAATALNLGSNFSSTGTVNFGGTGAISLAGTASAFHNVVIGNTASAGIAANTDWNIANHFTVNSGSILNAGSRTYTIGGNLTNNGTINSQASRFVLNGMETQEIFSLSPFNSLTINKTADSTVLLSDITVNSKMDLLAGTIDLNKFQLLLPGKAHFAAGRINNGLVTATGDHVTFGGTMFGAVVTATADSLYLNGSTFSNTATLTKNGPSLIRSSGGNTFNSTATITANSSADYFLGNAAPDTFNDNVIFANTGSGGLYIANNAPGNTFNGAVTLNNTGTGSAIHSGWGPLSTSAYNGNIILNNTATGIYFGASGGKADLAATKTISIGATGFATGTLQFNGFNQLGTTHQALTLTGSALLKTGPATVFNGSIAFSAPQVAFDGGSTFNGYSVIQKTGVTDNNSLGGNIFNGATTLVNSGSGNWVLGYASGADVFNNTLTLTNTGTAGIYPAFNTVGNAFNGDIILNQTAAGTIAFGGGTGTAILANGKAVMVGDSGFSAGNLQLSRLTQLGTAPQVLSLTGTALLQTGPAAEFNGSVDFSAPQLLLNGTNFKGTTTLTKNGATNNVSTGGNVFHGITTINNAGSGSFDLANTSADIFNRDVTINNTGTSRLQLGISSVGNQFNGNTTINYGGNTSGINLVVARNGGSTATFNGNLNLNCTNANAGSGIIIGNEGTVTINGNVRVSSTSGRGILFSDVAGSTTLGAGYTIADAGDGSFTTGTLKLSRFTQNSSTAQNVVLTGIASIQSGPSAQFSGAVAFSAPQLLLNGGQYNSAAILRKTGAGDNTSIGGNVYHAAATISNNGTGFLRLGNNSADTYNSHATFVQTGSGPLQPSFSTNSSIAGNLSTAGTATAISFGATVNLNGTGSQNILGTLAPAFNNLTVTNTGTSVAAGTNINIAGNLLVSNGTFDLGSYTTNRVTPGGTLTISNGAVLKIGGTNTLPSNYTTHSIGATSTIEYSGFDQSIAALNSFQTYGHLVVSGSGAQVNVNNITVRNNLTVSGSLNLNTNHLKVGGGIATSGNFNAAEGSVEFNGVSVQTIAPATFAGNMLKGLVIQNNAGVSLAGALNLTEVLTVSSGSLASNGHLTLKSTESLTARVAPITSAAVTPIIGHVTVERFVPGRRKYRLITSSVSSSEKTVLSPGEEAHSIWGLWQNSGINTTPNRGMLITGGTTADGFDPQTTNASVFTYDAVNRKYTGFSSANGKNTRYTPLKAGVAYYTFVYGDRRNSVVSSTIPNNTVLAATGTLKTGDQVYTATSELPLSDVAGRYTLLGNPFASPINWATLLRTDVANSAWLWDPNLSNTGGYVTVTTTGTATLTAPYSGAVGVDQYIQSGQGFFVKTTGAAPQLTIREQDKTGTGSNSAIRTFGRNIANGPLPATVNNIPLVAINLQYESAGTKVLADGVLAAFDPSFSNTIGAEDATKMSGSTEALAIVNGTELLSIDGRKQPNVKDTLYLNAAKLTKPQYSLQIFTKYIDESVQVYLEDNYRNTSQELVLNDTNNIVFSVVTSDPLSAAPNRFKVVFHPAAPLPVKFVSVKATPKAAGIQVEWKVAEESNMSKYEVQRSSDGVHFSKIGEVAAGNNANRDQYGWLDAQPSGGNNYYRIDGVEEGGRPIYSNIVLVKSTGAQAAIKVQPNPVQGAVINIQLMQLQKGTYNLQLYNMQGQLVYSEAVQHAGGSNTLTLYRQLAAGVYYLRLGNEEVKLEEKIFVNQ